MQESQAEAEIQRLKSELEFQVTRHTAQLEQANQELDGFRYSVSHDLRTPLRHILGHADIMEATAGQTLEETSREHLQAIVQSATQMGLMIDALLELFRIGRAEMRIQRVSLAGLVKEVLRDLRGALKGRDIDWQIEPLPEVQGDPMMLRQAVLNLLANAVKFTRPRTRAEIHIGAQTGRRETIFFVRDNGVGLNLDYAGKLFGVFQRFHPAGEFEGTGTGLAVVRRIIRRHGGRTWAEAKVDGGATFYLSVPKAAEEAT